MNLLSSFGCSASFGQRQYNTVFQKTIKYRNVAKQNPISNRFDVWCIRPRISIERNWSHFKSQNYLNLLTLLQQPE